MSKALTINEMEQELYSFINGVLPLVSQSGLGYKTRFIGYSLQEDSLNTAGDIIQRNECFIRAEKIVPIYLFPENQSLNYRIQESEFTYSIILQNRQTNFLNTDAMLQAMRICAHRGGYDLFRDCGISKLETTNTYVEAKKNISVFYAEIILRLVANIKLEKIKTDDNVDSLGITIYNYDKKVEELEIHDY